MKALTVCQPYATLIASGEKWVENRVWRPAEIPGLIAIHAGKSRKWLAGGTGDGLPFGAIVALARVDRIVHVGRLREMLDGGATAAHVAKVLSLSVDDVKKIAAHEHASGPWGWLLTDVRPLGRPVPVRGGRMLWDVPTAVRMAIRRDLGAGA